MLFTVVVGVYVDTLLGQGDCFTVAGGTIEDTGKLICGMGERL